MSDPNNPTRERGLLYGFMDWLGMFRHPAPLPQYQPALERLSERVAVELMMGGYQAGSDKKIDGWKRLDRDELRQRGVDADPCRTRRPAWTSPSTPKATASRPISAAPSRLRSRTG